MGKKKKIIKNQKHANEKNVGFSKTLFHLNVPVLPGKPTIITGNY